MNEELFSTKVQGDKYLRTEKHHRLQITEKK